MSPLHSRGSLTKGNKERSGPQKRGTKSQVAPSPLPSRGPKSGWECYAFSGITNATRKEKNQKWPPHPYLLGGPKEGGNATPPLHSWVSPTNGNKTRSGCLTPAFSRAQERAEMLCHPCIFGEPQRQAGGAKSEVPPQKGEQNEKWLPHPCLLGAQKMGGNAT